MKYQIVVALAILGFVAAQDEVATQNPINKLTEGINSALEDSLKKMQERVKGHVDFHKENLKDLGDKVNELGDRLKQTHGKVGKRVEELKKSFDGKLKEFVDKLFSHFNKEVREKRDAEQEVVDTPKGLAETFKDLHIENQARFKELRDHIRSQWEKNFANVKDRHERLKAVAKEVRDHASQLNADVVREAAEAFRPLREELGNIWNEFLTVIKNFLRKGGRKN
ncbi:hypothetical protein HDE_11219 [Halotydeus destructor]|nr:hypothetical protein HDE_13979 [Halotydeus destructor]KAI1286126.1 hypothetical protein HDE_11219 [Halotydeus destructor]